MAQAGGYFGSQFKGQHGVTQGESLSPTILNVGLDAFLRHWVSVAVEVEGGGRMLILYVHMETQNPQL